MDKKVLSMIKKINYTPFDVEIYGENEEVDIYVAV